MSLTETIYQINVTSNILLQAINSLKAIWKSSNQFLTMWQLCELQWFYLSVCYKADVNSTLRKDSKEPLSWTISTEASFNDDSNEKTLDIILI